MQEIYKNYFTNCWESVSLFSKADKLGPKETGKHIRIHMSKIYVFIDHQRFHK